MSDNNAAHPACISAEELQLHLPAYDSIELIAAGGMGAVYKARQVSLDRQVAIKVLTHACSSSLNFRQIFKCEAKVMAKLNHANLVSIYDYGEVNGMLFIVMQHIEGRNLHEAANGRAVAQSEAATLMATVCRALHHAHTAGILHRDIKPANILIDSSLDPVVVDFGLAHHSDDSTLKGDIVYGTPGYTAPEVLAPPYKADQRADVFSLGALLHELLTGELPRSPYLPPSRFGNVDPRYDAVCKRATHPCPAMRYDTAEALAEDLEKILADKELSTSSLLVTPAAHPMTPKSSPASFHSAQHKTVTPTRTASPRPRQSTASLPSLNTPKNRANYTKAAVITLAACLTFIIAVIALILSHQGSTKTAPVATGSPIIESTPVKH